MFGIMTVVEAAALFLALSKRNMYWLYHLYLPIDYALMILILSFWQSNGYLKRALRISIPVFIIVDLIYLFLYGSLTEQDSFGISLEYIIFVLTAAYTLYNLQSRDSGYLYRDYRFWICSGLLIYSASALAYFAFYDIFSEVRILQIWALHACLNIMSYLFYSAGIIIQYRNPDLPLADT